MKEAEVIDQVDVLRREFVVVTERELCYCQNESRPRLFYCLKSQSREVATVTTIPYISSVSISCVVDVDGWGDSVAITGVFLPKAGLAWPRAA